MLGSHIFPFDSSLPQAPITGERKIDSTIIIIINGKIHSAFAYPSDITFVTGLLDIDVTSVFDQCTDDGTMNDHNPRCHLHPFKCTQHPIDNPKGHIGSRHLLCLSYQTLSDNLASLEQEKKSIAAAGWHFIMGRAHRCSGEWWRPFAVFERQTSTLCLPLYIRRATRLFLSGEVWADK